MQSFQIPNISLASQSTGHQLQGTHANLSNLLAPSFLNIAAQDPLAPVFSSSQSLSFPSLGQNFDFSHNLSLAQNVPAQPLLPVASNCSQVPSFIVNAITSGQFVDFNLLPPNNLGKLPSSMPNDVQLSHLLRTDLKKISDFRDHSLLIWITRSGKI